MENKKINKNSLKPIEIKKSSTELNLQKENSTEVLAKAIKTILNKNK